MRAIVIALVLLAGLADARNGQRLFREMARYQVPSGAVTVTGFITTWVATNGGSITLPLRSGYTYDMSVDYGDGTVVNVNSNNDPDATHQFTSGDSNRTVTITGTMGAWYFNNGGSKANFRGVRSWEPVGGVAVLGMENAFYGCTAATDFANGIASSWIPVTSLSSTWRDCSGIKNGFPEVNTLTNVNTLVAAWQGCSGNTNVFPAVSNLTKVTTISSAWRGCSGIKNGFPEVNTLTNVNTLVNAWLGCSGNTNTFPSVSNLVKVTTLSYAWYGCSGIKNGFPEVNTLTNVNTLVNAWQGCSGNTNTFPSVSNLVKVTTLNETWNNCSASYFSMQSVLGDCSWITGQVKSVGSTFKGCSRMTGSGMPLVSAITNSPGYPTGYTITDCFDGCTNLTDWATIPAAFK